MRARASRRTAAATPPTTAARTRAGGSAGATSSPRSPARRSVRVLASAQLHPARSIVWRLYGEPDYTSALRLRQGSLFDSARARALDAGRSWSTTTPVRARPGRLRALSVSYRNSAYRGVYVWRAGCLTAENGGFGPGQWARSPRTTSSTSTTSCGSTRVGCRWLAFHLCS